MTPAGPDRPRATVAEAPPTQRAGAELSLAPGPSPAARRRPASSTQRLRTAPRRRRRHALGPDPAPDPAPGPDASPGGTSPSKPVQGSSSVSFNKERPVLAYTSVSGGRVLASMMSVPFSLRAQAAQNER